MPEPSNSCVTPGLSCLASLLPVHVQDALKLSEQQKHALAWGHDVYISTMAPLWRRQQKLIADLQVGIWRLTATLDHLLSTKICLAFMLHLSLGSVSIEQLTTQASLQGTGLSTFFFCHDLCASCACSSWVTLQGVRRRKTGPTLCAPRTACQVI